LGTFLDSFLFGAEKACRIRDGARTGQKRKPMIETFYDVTRKNNKRRRGNLCHILLSSLVVLPFYIFSL
jgi:hypothetical protein